MTTARFRLEHALVTDPLVSQSSGYRLVAQSPGVGAEDAAWLAAYPLITDHLHLEESPGHYFAYHPLRSGRWAFTHRFAQGNRRGNFNRIVVHSLVLETGDLNLLCQDPWLLLSKAVYGKDRQRLIALGADLAEGYRGPTEVGQTLLPLDVRLEGNPDDERWQITRSRLDNLQKKSDLAAVAGGLAEILSALAGGARLLWPQGPNEVQHMLLTWSMLPAPDRSNRGYTTHLNPNAASLFALANVPEPEQQIARLPGSDSGGWKLHDDLPPAAPWARDLCLLMTREPESFRHLMTESNQRQWTLGRDAERLGWAAYVALRGGPKTLLQGIQRPNELEAFLGRRRSLKFVLRGLALDRLSGTERSSFALAVVSAGLASLCEQENPAVAVPAFADVVRRGAPELLEVAIVEGLEKSFVPDIGSLGMVAAIGLLAGEKHTGAQELDRLAVIWKRHNPPPGEQTPMSRHVSQDLAVHSTDKGARSSGFFWGQLGADPGSSRALLTRISDEPNAKRRRRLATGGLRNAENPRLALALAKTIVPDLLAGESGDGLEGCMPQIVEIVSGEPRLFSQLLSSEHEDLAASARVVLDRLSKKRLAALAATWKANPSQIEPLRDRELLVGLAALFSKSEISPSHWLSLALAEARVLDAHGPTVEESRAFAHAVRNGLDPQTAYTGAQELVEAIRLAVHDRRFGDHHRELVIAFLKEGQDFSRYADALQPILKRAWDGATPLGTWAPIVDEIVQRLRAAELIKTASAMAADWLIAVLRKRQDGWDPKHLELIGLLDSQDLWRFCEEIVRRVPQLPKIDLWEAMLTRSRPLIEQFPTLAGNYLDALQARSVEHGQDFLQAFDAKLKRRLPDYHPNNPLSPEGCDRAAQWVQDLLPRGKGRAAALIRLLTDQNRPPWFLEAMQERLLQSEKNNVLPYLAQELPQFEVLEKHASRSLLMVLASWLGEAWRFDERGTRRFLQRATEKRYFDVVGAFLRRAERLETGFLEKANEDMRRRLRRAVADPIHWTDLGPLKRQILSRRR